MKMSKVAVEQMMDSYADRIIDLYNDLKHNHIWNFPMKLAQEAKAIHEEICWMEEGGWITGEDAQILWEDVEDTAEEFMEDWENEMKN